MRPLFQMGPRSLGTSVLGSIGLWSVLCSGLCIGQGTGLGIGKGVGLGDPGPSPIDTPTLTIRGRFVADENGAPIEGCRVRLTGQPSLAAERADWVDPAEVRSGADGRFAVEIRMPAANGPYDQARYYLYVRHAERAGWFSMCDLSTVVRRGGIDYGDVRLPVGVRPRIRVQDAAGKLQPGVRVGLRPVELDPQWIRKQRGGPDSWVDVGFRLRTDIDGYVHPDTAVPADDYEIEVFEREVLELPGTVRIPGAEVIVAVVDTPDAQDRIEGRLLTEAGQPLGGVAVEADQGRRIRATTRRDGRFTLIRPAGGADVDAMLSRELNTGHRGGSELGRVEWGTLDAEFRVPETHARTMVVRDREGASVEAYNLYCLPVVEGPSVGVRLSGTFDGGRAPTRLATGDYDVFVWPHSARLARSGWRRVTVAERDDEIVFELDEAQSFAVDLSFADGTAPPAGTLVEFVVGPEPGPFESVRPISLDLRPGRQPLEARLVASARTDASGRAVLRVAEVSTGFARVSGRHLLTRVHGVSPRTGAAIELRVQKGAALIGSLAPLDRLLALDPDGERDPRGPLYDFSRRTAPSVTLVGDGWRREAVPLDPQGRFRCEGVPAGRVEVRLRYYRARGNVRSPVDGPQLGTVELKLGEMVERAFEVPDSVRDG